MITITALNVYPVKSCAGIALTEATLTQTGFEHDRQWMIVQPNGRHLTQREVPKLALIRPSIDPTTLTLHAPDIEPLQLDLAAADTVVEVQCWSDRCRAYDAGERARAWLAQFLGQPYRLVRFDPSFERPSDSAWTGGIKALNQFSDGFPWLLLSQASLDDLNSRLEQPLPMNRFRPNIVVAGLPAYGEDAIAELTNQRVALRPVKACTRCAITTTNQELGERSSDEPLRTLRTYRLDRELKGVTFGQNVIIMEKGLGEKLRIGETLEAVWKTPRGG